jgi:uncharacterized protein YndB with AHSA1/START domain
VPTYTAERTLFAPVEDVWAFLAEPHHLPDWWPGLGGVQPDRRGVAPAARWAIQTSRGDEPLRPLFGPGMLKRPNAAGTLLVLEVVPGRRFSFQLVNENITAEIDLAEAGENRTAVTLVVEASWGTVRRSYAKEALRRLYDLVQTGDEL